MMIIEEPDYTLTGKDLTGFWLQPGFVEGITADRKRFRTLENAYRHIFRNNLEYGIILWNGLPVRFSYPEDLSLMVTPLIEMLENLIEPKSDARVFNMSFRTPNLEATWKVESGLESITIEGFWHHVTGGYEAAFNQLGMIRMPCTAFLAEWKLLLQQLVQAITDAKAVLIDKDARDQLERLEKVEERIQSKGRFYQY